MTSTFYQMFVDDKTISAGTTDTTPSMEIDVGDVDIIALQIKATGGDASSTGIVTAKLTVSVDGENFDTVAFAEIPVTLDGTDEVRQTTLVNVSGCKSVRIEEIENGDSYEVSGVNVLLGKLVV